MQKQLKTNSEDNNNDKALNRLASFFVTQNDNVRFGQEYTQKGSACSEKVLVLN